jgi:predicted alpha-1,6-mannanase (GH76 family)
MSLVHDAVAAREVLLRDYWDDGARIFRPEPAEPTTRRRSRLGLTTRWRSPGPWHYWWQAHALQVLLDGVEAADGTPAAAVVPVLVHGVTAHSGGDLTRNDFYDDLAWMGLATWRAWTAGLVPARVPLALAAAVLPGYTPDRGGFRWRRGDGYRNVAASATAAILLARTADAADEPQHLEIARSTAHWLHENLVDTSGLVADGVSTRGDDDQAVKTTFWSYNAAAVASLDLELAGHGPADERARALQRAATVVRAGTAALRAAPDSDGHTWRDEAAGATVEAALFRGILATAVADFLVAHPEDTSDLAAELRAQAGAAVRARDLQGRIGAGWLEPEPGTPSLAAHLAGCLTLAAAARLPGAPGNGPTACQE